MERTILKKQELAERWGVTTQCIDKYESEGVITRLKSFKKAPMYSLNDVLIAEEFDKGNSLLEVRRLKRENTMLREENEKLNQKLNLVRQALI